MTGAPSSGPPLVGRDAELARLSALLTGDDSIAVTGEAGVGKTSVVHAAVGTCGRELLEGGGFATLARMPYLALTRALRRPIVGDAVEAASLVERLVGPRLLFIDDLQWVDEGTRIVLERLAGRIQLVVAVRTDDPGAAPAVDLARRLTSTVLSLEGLDDAAATAVVRRVAPDLPAASVSRTVRRAGGNPLLLEEMAMSRETVGVLGRALAARRERLSPGAQDDLDLLAVADRPLAAEALHSGRELLASGLVRAHGDDLGIRHSLLAESIRERLPTTARRALHGRLAALATSDLERAAHLLDAGRPEEAAAVARATLDSVVEHRQRAGLLVALARATGSPADIAAAAAALYAVFDFAGVLDIVPEDMPRSTSVGQRALYERARSLRRIGRTEEALALASAILAEVEPGSEVSARLVVLTATLTVNHLVDPEGALRLISVHAPEHAPGSRERTWLDALTEAIRMHLGQPPDLGPMFRAVEADARDSQVDFAGRALDLVKMIVAVSGAMPALEFAQDASRRSRDAGFTAAALDILVQAAQCATFAGRFDQAVVIADELLEQPVSPRARLYGLLHGLEAYAYLGHFEIAAARIQEARSIPVGERMEGAEIDIVELGVAYWSGRLDRASVLVDRLLGDALATDLNLAVPRKYGAWIDLELGRPVRTVPPLNVRVLAGLPHEVEGVRSLAADRPRDAHAEFARAADLYAGFLEPDAMQCRWAAAESLRRAGDPIALDGLRAIEAEAEATGFHALLPRIRRSLRLAGVRVAGRPSSPRGPGLTARESELVELVERGLSNIEIARRLGLGRPTVARTLASAMGKLGVDRRTQLAAREPV